jgi:hypothetical protein
LGDYKRLLVFILFLTALPEVATATGTISGRIVDSVTLNPIQSAIVEAIPSGTTTAAGSATTNAAGDYIIPGLASSCTYTVFASANNYQTKFYFNGTSSDVYVMSSQPTSSINFNLISTGVRGGKIAFISRDASNENYVLYIANADGTHQTPLFTSNAYLTFPLLPSLLMGNRLSFVTTTISV